MKSNDIIKPYILRLEEDLKIIVDKNSNELKEDVLGFLFAKSKRIRPVFTYLCTFLLNEKIDDDICRVALAVELLHSATLVHDDVLDESLQRREIESFYSKLGSKKSVVTGDYILSLCLLALSEIQNSEILKIFSNNIIKTINGEINQFSSQFCIQSEKDYFYKTAPKTANLFVCIVQSVCCLKNVNLNVKKSLENFAYNFGVVFQINNDVKNILSTQDDVKNGIYTLPYIYFKQENPTCDIINFSKKQALKYCKAALNKSRQIIDKAFLELDFCSNTQAKDRLKSLCDELLRI